MVDASRPLSSAEKTRLVAEILLTYLHVRWWVRRGDLAETMTRLRAAERSRPGQSPELDVTGVRLGRAVSRTLRLLPFDSRCLMRSLVLARLLARRGIDGSLVIGVRPQPSFEAHAWVEHAGRPLLPPAEAGYERLLEI